MTFSTGVEVIYKEMYGVIDFICDAYLVIRINSFPDRSSPRLIVHRQNYKEVEILKASGK